MPRRRKLCLAAIVAQTLAPNHMPRSSGSAPAPQRDRRDEPPHGTVPALGYPVAPKLHPAAYAAQMMCIEGQRNAACRQGDVQALRLVAERRAWLNHRFWGRVLN
jgi:hypothetical protein